MKSIDTESFQEQINPASPGKPRYKKRYVARIGCIEEYGDSITEAQNKALTAAEKALAWSDFNPLVITWRGTTMVGYRIPNGLWAYDILHWSTPPTTAFGYESKEEVKRHMCSHLAQMAWATEQGHHNKDYAGHMAEDIITNKEDLEDFRRWAKWQLRYERAKERGLNHEDAWQEASIGD